jgi:hypothetical protein
MKTAQSSRRIADHLAVAYVVFAIGFALHTSYRVLRDHFTVPHFDDWRILHDYFATPLASWLITDQVGHRFPVTLFLLHLDYTLAGGHMHLLVIGSLACAWLAGLALYVGLRADDETPPALRRAVFAFGLFCIFWSGDFFDFIWGMNQGSQLCRMWLLVVLSALALGYARRRRGEAVPIGFPLVAGGAAVLATFSQGIGAATWVGVGVVAAIARYRPAVVGAFVLIGLSSVVLYSMGLQHVAAGTHRGYLALVLGDAVNILEFIVLFVGSPIAYVLSGVGWIDTAQMSWVAAGAGAIGIVGAVGYVLVAARRGRLAAIDLIASGLMAFAVAGGLLVGLHRSAFPTQAVNDRFMMWGSLFWMGAGCAVGARMGLAIKRTWVVVMALWVASVAMIPALLTARAKQGATNQMLSVIATMHRSGVRADAFARSGSTPYEMVYEVVGRLRRDRRSFFSDGRAGLVGSRLVERFATTPAQCGGGIQLVRPLESRRAPAAIVFGRVDGGGERAPAFIVVTDAAGIIRGLGTMTPRPFPEHALGGTARPQGTPWVGFIADFDITSRYAAHAILADDRTTCRVGVASAAP